ncbi:MAG: hypothetical protein R6U98_03910 [Pirellulaceae bacterium]
MESGPTQTVLPLVGLAAEKVIRDRYKHPGLFTHPSMPAISREPGIGYDQRHYSAEGQSDSH